MGLWNLNQVASTLQELCIAEGREADSLARWIWEEIMGWPSPAEKNIDGEEEQKIHNAINRLAAGEPIQYIAGHAWFYGIRLKVTPDVLIPRPETEELVHWILTDLKKTGEKGIHILDIGTGSGCISVALKTHLGNRATILAADVSPNALIVARENADFYGVDIKFIQRDFLNEGLHDLGQFDIIVSNPPYISKYLAGEEVINRLSREPELALYPDQDDTDIFYKRIASTAKGSLYPGACCYVEMNEFRTDQIGSYFKDHGWASVEMRKDLQGMNRMLKAQYTS